MTKPVTFIASSGSLTDPRDNPHRNFTASHVRALSTLRDAREEDYEWLWKHLFTRFGKPLKVWQDFYSVMLLHAEVLHMFGVTNPSPTLREGLTTFCQWCAKKRMQEVLDQANHATALYERLRTSLTNSY